MKHEYHEGGDALKRFEQGMSLTLQSTQTNGERQGYTTVAQEQG